tara:strand:+ start:9650 stop:9931 length:282 start_codon:yes stop_codon:yes gene_type:complete
MALVLLAGDMNMNGGISSTAQTLVTIGGVPIEVHGSIVSSHLSSAPPAMEIATTSSSTQLVYINGKGVDRVGDQDTCGHPRNTSGQTFVNVNN